MGGLRSNIMYLCMVPAIACGRGSGAGAKVTGEILRLSEAPVIDIGVAEGNPSQELTGASSALRLSDGRIVIANSGTSEIRIFDSTGTFLKSIGRRGEGPGEFMGSLKLAYLSDTAFAVFDQGSLRLTVFDTTGVVRNESRAARAERMNDFPLWVWLHRNAWIVGPVDTSLRTQVAAAIETLPALAPGSYRYVQIATDGRIWTQERSGSGERQVPWRVYSASGVALGQVTLPANTEVHQIGRDFILLRSWAADDVEHIRLYQLPDPPEDPGPAATASVPLMAASASKTLRTMSASLRGVVTAQEVFYMDHGAYATVADSLSWESPEPVTLHLMAADTRGWVGALVHQSEPVLCGMAVGSSTPPGWVEGSPKCSR